MVNKLFNSGAAASTVAIDMRADGNIVGVLLSCESVVAGAVELSFNSTANFGTNDTSGVVACISTTSGGANAFIQLSEPVSVGERLFLHVNNAVGDTYATVYTDAKEVRSSPRRR